jgi:hypothetical protein
MGLERDIERIRAANTLEGIRSVTREHSAKASDKAASLCSGRVGNVSANDLAVEHAKRSRASIINNAPLGQLLAHERIDEAIKEKEECRG